MVAMPCISFELSICSLIRVPIDRPFSWESSASP